MPAPQPHNGFLPLALVERADGCTREGALLFFVDPVRAIYNAAIRRLMAQAC